MARQHIFRMAGTTIDLSHVVDVAQPYVPENAPDGDAWVMVRLDNDLFTTVKGRRNSRAFMEALERYASTDLN